MIKIGDTIKHYGEVLEVDFDKIYCTASWTHYIVVDKIGELHLIVNLGDKYSTCFEEIEARNIIAKQEDN